MEERYTLPNTFKKRKRPVVFSVFTLSLLVLLVHPTRSSLPTSSDHVTLSVTDNGLRELRVSHQGLLLLEISLAYQIPWQGGVSLTRVSDGETLLELASRHGLVEDCAVKTSKRDLKLFKDDFFDVHNSMHIVTEADVMAVYMGTKKVSDIIALPANNKLDMPKANSKTLKNYEPFTLHAVIGARKYYELGFLTIFRQHLDINKRSQNCREFYRQARERLLLLYSFVNETETDDKLKQFELKKRPIGLEIHLESASSSHRKKSRINRQPPSHIDTSHFYSQTHRYHPHQNRLDRQQTHHRHHEQVQSYFSIKTQHRKPHRFRYRKSFFHNFQSLLRPDRAVSQTENVHKNAKYYPWHVRNFTSRLFSLSSTASSISSPRTSGKRHHLSSPPASDERLSYPSSPSHSSKVQSKTLTGPRSRIHQLSILNSTHVGSQPEITNPQISSGHLKQHTDFYDLISQRHIRRSNMSPKSNQYSSDSVLMRSQHEEDKHSINKGPLSRHKRDLLSGYFIVPGTKWCGDGDIADGYDDLGVQADVDKCCRRHDHCSLIIPRLSTRFGLFNYRLHTISHCHCDRKMRHCLERQRSPMAEITGQLYFNLVGPACFKLRETTSCVTSFWWGGCREYVTTKVAYTKSQRRFKTRAHRRREIKRKLRKGKLKEAKRLRKTMKRRKMKRKKLRMLNKRKKSETGAAALSYSSLNEMGDTGISDSLRVLELPQNNSESANMSQRLVASIEEQDIFYTGKNDDNTNLVLDFSELEKENSTFLENQEIFRGNETNNIMENMSFIEKYNISIGNKSGSILNSTLMDNTEFSNQKKTISRERPDPKSLPDRSGQPFQNDGKQVPNASPQTLKDMDQISSTTIAPSSDSSWWFFF